MPRFKSALDRFGARLLARVFCEAEVAYAQRKRDGTHNLAARFAAKCAGRRALRRLGVRVGWRDLEVVRRRGGEPTLVLSAAAAKVSAQGQGAQALPRAPVIQGAQALPRAPVIQGAQALPRAPVMRLSLTHDPEFAAATLFIERGDAA